MNQRFRDPSCVIAPLCRGVFVVVGLKSNMHPAFRLCGGRMVLPVEGLFVSSVITPRSSWAPASPTRGERRTEKRREDHVEEGYRRCNNKKYRHTEGYTVLLLANTNSKLLWHASGISEHVRPIRNLLEQIATLISVHLPLSPPFCPPAFPHSVLGPSFPHLCNNENIIIITKNTMQNERSNTGGVVSRAAAAVLLVSCLVVGIVIGARGSSSSGHLRVSTHVGCFVVSWTVLMIIIVFGAKISPRPVCVRFL